MILITEYFLSNNSDRQKEYITCLKMNLKNQFIEKIILFNSDNSIIDIQSDKIKMIYVKERPTYKSIFDYCNKYYKNEICIIANADIVLDDSLSHITNQNITGKFLALSRWDIIENNKAQLYDWSYSQDCWIYLAPYDIKGGEYTMGRLGCDNRIAYDAKSSGLQVTNPAKLIKTFHLHRTNHRTYKHDDIIMGSFLFVETCDSMDKISDSVVCDPKNLNQVVHFTQRKNKTKKTYNKLISYSFFTPKKIYQHRFWDKTNNKDRYWYNIPILMTINKIIYPDFDILIQISPDIVGDYRYEIIDKLSKSFNIKIEVNSKIYNDTEPTVWRYKPLFDIECDILLCRDIDSIPTKIEFLSTKEFIDSDRKLHTLRTHTNHSTPATIILAGLCGFKPRKTYFLNFDFNYYYDKIKNLGWGLDQQSIIQLFNKGEWLEENFLDCSISTDTHKVSKSLFPCLQRSEFDYQFESEFDDIFEIIDKYVTWSGEPVDFRGNPTTDLLKLEYKEFLELKEIFDNLSDSLKIFYKYV